MNNSIWPKIFSTLIASTFLFLSGCSSIPTSTGGLGNISAKLKSVFVTSKAGQTGEKEALVGSASHTAQSLSHVVSQSATNQISVDGANRGQRPVNANEYFDELGATQAVYQEPVYQESVPANLNQGYSSEHQYPAPYPPQYNMSNQVNSEYAHPQMAPIPYYPADPRLVGVPHQQSSSATFTQRYPPHVPVQHQPNTEIPATTPRMTERPTRQGAVTNQPQNAVSNYPTYESAVNATYDPAYHQPPAQRQTSGMNIQGTVLRNQAQTATERAIELMAELEVMRQKHQASIAQIKASKLTIATQKGEIKDSKDRLYQANRQNAKFREMVASLRVKVEDLESEKVAMQESSDKSLREIESTLDSVLMDSLSKARDRDE